MKNHLIIIYSLIVALFIGYYYLTTGQTMHMRKTIELYKAINLRDSVGMRYVQENTQRWENSINWIPLSI